MIPINKITGRLGNQMFQFAALYAYSRHFHVDYYFQNEQWFKKYEREIREMYGTGIEPNDYVSIHVRRGDYLIQPNSDLYIDLCATDYYERAISLFPDSKFMVFSDDLDWCRQKWGDDSRFAFSIGRDEVADLNYMAGCQGHIIANSSFSWWAAWLGGGPIVAPREWFQDGIERCWCPKHWFRISVQGYHPSKWQKLLARFRHGLRVLFKR